MTWEEMIKIEPALEKLYEMAQKEHLTAGEDYCANRIWYTEMKPVLQKLVGHFAEDSRLRSSDTYDTAYKKILRALPDCTHEGVFC